MGSQVIRYCIVGLGNTVIGVGCIAFGLTVLKLGDVGANVLGYALAAGFGYVMNRRFTFRHQGAIGRSSRRYAMVLAAAYLCNLGMVVLARDGLGAPSYIAQACGMATYTVAAFLGSRTFAFAAA